MKPIRPPLEIRIIFWYAVFGALWISLSDYLLLELISDPVRLTHIQSYKGWLFVMLSTLLMYWLLKRDRNISSRLTAERALHESEARYQNYVNQSPVGIAIHCDGRVVFANPTAVNLLGAKSASQIIGKSLDEIIDPDSLQTAKQRIQRMISGEKGLYPVEDKVLRLDGTSVHVEVMASLLTYEGRPAVQVIITDITERRLEKDKIQTFAHAVNQMEEFVVITDLEDKITFVNRAFSKRYGYTSAEIIGQHVSILRADRTPREIHTNLLNQNRTRSWQGELWNKAKNGEEFPISLRTSRITDSRGVLVGLFGISHDITEQKRIESTITEQAELLKSLLSTISEGFWLVDSHGSLLEVNEAYSTMTGYSHEELLTLPIWKLDVHHSAEMVNKKLDDIRQQGSVVFERQHRRKDGQIIDVQISASYWPDRDQYFVFIQDITERKLAEQSLKDLEQKLSNIVHHSTNLFYSHSPDHVLSFVSPQSRHFLGCDPDEAKLRWTEFVTEHPVNEKGFESTQRAILTGQIQQPYELQLKTLDGRILWVVVNEAPVVKGGQTVAIVGSLTDITERKKVEENLERLHLAAESSGEIIFTTDLDGVITYINPSFTTTYGFTADEVIGKVTPRILKSTKTPPEEHRQLWRTISSGGKLSLEIVNRTKDGRLLDIESSLNPILDQQGSVVGYVAVQRDVTERKKSEIRMAQLSAAVEQTAGLVFITRIDGTIEYVNQSLEELSGYSKKELLGENPRILASGLHDMAFFRNFWSTILSGKTWHGTFINRTKSGRLFHHQQAVTALKDQKGIVTRFVSTGTDITENIGIHELLVEKERRLSDAEEISAIGSFTYEIENAEWAFSDGFNKILEVPLDTESGIEQTFLGMIHYADRTAVLDRAAQLIRGEEYTELEFRIVRADQVVRHFRARAKTHFDEDGQPHRIAGTVQDITQHKWAEDALRASEQKYKDIVQWASVGIYQSMADGQIIMANQRLAHMLGYDGSEELLRCNMGLDIYYEPRDRDRLIEQYDKDRRGFVANKEILWKKKDGTPIWISLSAHAVKEMEQTLYYEGFVIDISDRKRAEQDKEELWVQLSQAQKLESLGTLAGGIAHDFNNILGIVLGYSVFLRKNLNDPARVTEGFTSIDEAVDRGKGLVRQLLTFARKSDSKPELISINDELKTFSRLAKETLPKTIRMNLVLSEKTPLIRADRTQINQVFLNLVVNSRDAMGGDGDITISTESVDGTHLRERFPATNAATYVHIRFKDSGCGMSPELMAHIFEPFFTTKESGKGTGLGLAVTFGIIKSHSGILDVESEVGSGTTFHIYLPTADETVAQKDGLSDSDEVPGGDETILIVEDEDRLRKLLALILEDSGYTVLNASNGNDAITLFKRRQKEISMIITDLDMPKVNGIDVARSIREADSSVKIMIASGFIEPAVRELAKRYDVEAVLQKPYNADQITRTVRQILDNTYKQP